MLVHSDNDGYGINRSVNPKPLRPATGSVKKQPRRKPPKPIETVREDGFVEIECNKRLINETAEELNIKISTIEQVLQHYSEFIAITIRSGNMEGVFVPYLGKFQVKHKHVQMKDFTHTIPGILKRKLIKDSKGNVTFDELFENNTDGTICD